MFNEDISIATGIEQAAAKHSKVKVYDVFFPSVLACSKRLVKKGSSFLPSFNPTALPT